MPEGDDPSNGMELPMDRENITCHLCTVTLSHLPSGTRNSCDIDLKEVLAVPSKRCAISFQAKAVLLLYPWSRCTLMRNSQADAKAFRLVDSSIAQDGTKTKLCQLGYHGKKGHKDIIHSNHPCNCPSNINFSYLLVLGLRGAPSFSCGTAVLNLSTMSNCS